MSECANCNVSVYVPDGYEFEEGDLCMSCTKAKADRLQALVDSADESNGAMMWTIDHDKILARQEKQWKTWGVIEIAVRNPSVSEYMNHWEGRATKAEAENEKLRDCIRELLKGGEHEGESTNEFMEHRGPCVRHIDKSDEREAAARRLLEELDAV